MNEQDGEALRVSVGKDKYTVVQEANGELRALRYGEPWRNCVGDKLVLALATELDDARKEAQRAWGCNASQSAIIAMTSEVRNAQDKAMDALDNYGRVNPDLVTAVEHAMKELNTFRTRYLMAVQICRNVADLMTDEKQRKAALQCAETIETTFNVSDAANP